MLKRTELTNSITIPGQIMVTKYVQETKIAFQLARHSRGPNGTSATPFYRLFHCWKVFRHAKLAAHLMVPNATLITAKSAHSGP